MESGVRLQYCTVHTAVLSADDSKTRAPNRFCTTVKSACNNFHPSKLYSIWVVPVLNNWRSCYLDGYRLSINT
jgi:hypothetical protein